MRRKLLLNSLSGTALYVVNVVVAFVMSPIIINALGNRDYGLWELVMSVIGYMGLLDLGIGTALVRFVSVAEGKQDGDDLRKTISTSFAFFVVVGVAAVLIFLLLGYFPQIVAGSEAKDITNLGTVFMLLGLNAGMTFPLQVFIATLMGVQRHYFINFTRILLVTLQAATNYFLLITYQGRGLLVMALTVPLFTALQVVAFALAVSLDKNIPKFTLKDVSWIKAKEMISFGAKSATMLVASRLQNQSVPLIIGNFIGLGSIVYFVMPNRLVDYAKGLSLAMGFPLTPYFGASIGRNANDELLKSWLITTLALQIISLAMPVMILFCGEAFLRLWIGQEYAEAGRVVLFALTAGLVADSLATNAFRMLTAQGKHGRCSLMWLVLSVVSIPLGVGGAKLWGVAGVAAATTVATVTANLVTVYMTCSVMGVSLQDYFSRTLQRVLFPLLILAITLGVCRVVLPITGYVDLIIHLLFAGTTYLPAVWLFTLDEVVRERLLAKVMAALASR